MPSKDTSKSLKYVHISVPEADFYTLLDQVVLLASQRRQRIVRYLNEVAADVDVNHQPGPQDDDTTTTTSPSQINEEFYHRSEDGRTFHIDLKKLRELCRPVLVAVAGVAGSGKTILARAVSDALTNGLIGSGFLRQSKHEHTSSKPTSDSNDSDDDEQTAKDAVEEKHRQQLLLHESKKKVNVVCVPLDGYHKTREELSAMEDPEMAFKRRGAPYTFDPVKYLNDLRLLVTTASASFPEFEHAKKDPEEGAIIIDCVCDWRKAVDIIAPIVPVEAVVDSERIEKVLKSVAGGAGSSDGGDIATSSMSIPASTIPPPASGSHQHQPQHHEYSMLDELNYTQELFDLITETPEVVIVEGIYTLFNGVQPKDSPVPPITCPRELQSWAAASSSTPENTDPLCRSVPQPFPSPSAVAEDTADPSPTPQGGDTTTSVTPDKAPPVNTDEALVDNDSKSTATGNINSAAVSTPVAASPIQPPTTREYYYDLRVFVSCPLEVATERLTKRHMAAWHIPREEAYERASGSDLDNAHIVQTTLAQADIILSYSEAIVKLRSKLYKKH